MWQHLKRCSRNGLKPRIDVKIGTTWIEPLDYEQFIYELLNTPRRAREVRSQFYNTGIQVHLNKMSMEWFIENKSMDKHSVAATKTYGTSRMDAYSIFEDTLNLKTVTVRDRIDDGDGRYHYEVNKNETMLAREKQNMIKEKFKEWLFAEPERRQKYVEYYNETFNNIRLREYDGSHLQFPGMNPAGIRRMRWQESFSEETPCRHTVSVPESPLR